MAVLLVQVVAAEVQWHKKGIKLKSATAILIFSRTAKAEARHKNIAVNRRSNIAAHSFLLNKTIATVGETGLPYFHLDENNQSGITFEERLLDAFNRVFQLGYENILCIGSDCPKLNSIDLVQSKIAVENETACFGADNHGGVYLIAVTKKQVEAGLFNSISWNTQKVLYQLTTNAVILNFEYNVLSVCHDINGQKDMLQYFKANKISPSLKWALATLLGIGKQFINLVFQIISNSELKSVTILRGPPVYC